MASPVSASFRRSLSVALLAASLVSHAQSQFSPKLAPAQRHPVLVELFTSEGCSDCPPADELLARLDATQFVPGALAIVLSEHVTYWNHLGWSDPFSFDAIDERQRQYSIHFSLGEVYTPQIVVDGSRQLVGSNFAALRDAVESAVHTSKSQIEIKNAQWAEGIVHFSVLASPSPRATLIVALAEDATRSVVARGENAGRTLHHVAVVRVLKQLDNKVTDGRPLTLSFPDHAHASTTPVRLVVFLADTDTGHVIGVAQQTVNR